MLICMKTLGNAQSGRDCLRELFITKFKSQFKRVFTDVVVTRTGRLWSLDCFDCTSSLNHFPRNDLYAT